MAFYRATSSTGLTVSQENHNSVCPANTYGKKWVKPTTSSLLCCQASLSVRVICFCRACLIKLSTKPNVSGQDIVNCRMSFFTHRAKPQHNYPKVRAILQNTKYCVLVRAEAFRDNSSIAVRFCSEMSDGHIMLKQFFVTRATWWYVQEKSWSPRSFPRWDVKTHHYSISDGNSAPDFPCPLTYEIRSLKGFIKQRPCLEQS